MSHHKSACRRRRERVNARSRELTNFATMNRRSGALVATAHCPPRLSQMVAPTGSPSLRKYLPNNRQQSPGAREACIVRSTVAAAVFGALIAPGVAGFGWCRRLEFQPAGHAPGF